MFLPAHTAGFAKTVSGADSLVLNIGSLSLHQLAEKPAITLSLFKADDYSREQHPPRTGSRFPFAGGCARCDE